MDISFKKAAADYKRYYNRIMHTNGLRPAADFLKSHNPTPRLTQSDAVYRQYERLLEKTIPALSVMVNDNDFYTKLCDFCGSTAIDSESIRLFLPGSAIVEKKKKVMCALAKERFDKNCKSNDMWKSCTALYGVTLCLSDDKAAKAFYSAVEALLRLAAWLLEF